MKKLLFVFILIIALDVFSGFLNYAERRKVNKELKEIKMTIDNVESQLKILTPPPEFMQLPITRENKK